MLFAPLTLGPLGNGRPVCRTAGGRASRGNGHGSGLGRFGLRFCRRLGDGKRSLDVRPRLSVTCANVHRLRQVRNGSGIQARRPRPRLTAQWRGGRVPRLGVGRIRTGRQGGAPEAFVADFQGLARLPCPPKPSGEDWARRAVASWRRRVNLPVRDMRTGGRLAQQRLDLRTAQVPASSAGVLREESAHPPNAERDCLLLRPRFPKGLDVARRLLGRRVGGRGREVMRHINPASFAHMPHAITITACVPTHPLRHIIPGRVDMFEAE